MIMWQLMRRIRNVVGLVFTLIIIIFGVVFETENVFGAAGSNAPTSPSSCSLYGQCYGLGWEKYGKNEVPSGTRKLENGDIYVYGTNQGAGSGTIRASKCKSSYWRLAWYVAHDDTASNGFSYKHNDQIGLMSLSDAHNTYGYNVNSIPGTTAAKNDWDNLSSTERMGYTWGDNSSLAWFCAERTDVTLTAYAVTEYRSSDSAHKFLKTNGSVSRWLTSPPSDAYKVPKTVDWGASSDVTVDLVLGTDNSPYKFNTWGDSCPSSSRSGTKCTINPLKNNKNVYAYYKLVDPLPCGGGYSSTVCDSTIDINQSKNQDSGYTKNALYMKPGEKVYLKGSFISDYQNKKDMKPQRIKLFSNDNKYLNTPNWSNNNFTGVYTIQTYFNAYRDSSWKNAGSWKNAFSIMSNGESLKDVSGTVGSNDKYGDSNSSDIGTYLAKLGTSRSAKSQTNQTSGTKNTPERIVFSYDGNYDLQANVDIDPKESETVTTYTPYNFENEINGEVLVDGETESSWDRDNPASLAAGEDKTFDFNISTNPIYNSVIGDTYATAVPNAKWKLRYTYNGRTMETDPTSIQDALHNVTNGNLPYLNSEALGLEYDLKTYNAPVVRKKSITINVPDLPAGSTICVKALVWPASSRYPGQEYKNWNHPEGDNQWAESPERCFVIAKKPNFQVWGGGVYSAGNLGTRVSVKGHVAANKDDAMQGLSNYSLIPSNYTVFGSWGELGLVANGTVTGLASGAGTGYGTTTDATTPFASPSRLGGSVEGTKPSYCFRSTLSFANNNCSSDSVGNLSSIQANTSSDRSSLVSRFSDVSSEEYTLELYDSDTTIGGIEMAEGTRVIKAENNTITINHNIEYSSGTYTTLESIPKLIIYANNININCSVNRIDAVLIANEDINTCADISDINSIYRSNPLIINGTTISNTLTLGRTYGAATGINSIIPAEIINYDSSLLLWSNSQSGVTSTGKLTEAYTSELAPRY